MQTGRVSPDRWFLIFELETTTLKRALSDPRASGMEDAVAKGHPVLPLFQLHYRGVNSRKLSVALQLSRALAHIALCGFVHRDVKPANIFLSRKQNTTVVKLGDLGLARPFLTKKREKRDMSRPEAGTENYKAPEQWEELAEEFGQCIGPPADIWQFGCVFLELVTLKIPWTVLSNGDEIETEDICGLIRQQLRDGGGPCQHLLKNLNFHRNGRNIEQPFMLDAVTNITHRCLDIEPDRRVIDFAAIEKELTIPWKKVDYLEKKVKDLEKKVDDHQDKIEVSMSLCLCEAQLYIILYYLCVSH
jgi:serine/threonine protein kinase